MTRLPPLPLALEERIEALNNEIEALIQDRVALEKAQCPGIPEATLRQMFDAKFGKCRCLAYKQFKDAP
jgi:hypothetical protein